jgi:hypothetical protein
MLIVLSPEEKRSSTPSITEERTGVTFGPRACGRFAKRRKAQVFNLTLQTQFGGSTAIIWNSRINLPPVEFKSP